MGMLVGEATDSYIKKINSNLWRKKYVRNFYFINYSNVISSKIL